MPTATNTASDQQPTGYGLRLATSLFSLFLIAGGTCAFADEAATTSTMPALDKSDTTLQEPVVDEKQAVENGNGKIPEELTRGKVTRAVFTSQISDREPTDDLTEISNSSDRIYFFTDLRGLQGQIVTHRWEYNNEVMAEVKFKVGDGPRWRVYSSKNLLPEWLGVWTVSVTDENGETLTTSVFNYIQAVETTENNTAADAPVTQ